MSVVDVPIPKQAGECLLRLGVPIIRRIMTVPTESAGTVRPLGQRLVDQRGYPPPQVKALCSACIS